MNQKMTRSFFNLKIINMKIYIYGMCICVLLSWCTINTPNINISQTGDILYTGESYSWLKNESGTDLSNTNIMYNSGDVFGSATGLAQTDKSDTYMSPPYLPVSNCNRESRKTIFSNKNIYMMVLNCKFDDGKYTINTTGDIWTEDKYISSERVPDLQIIKMFGRKNISNFDELWIKAPKWCVFKKVDEDKNFEQWEILTTGAYTTSTEQKLLNDNSYLPCGEYGYSAIWRRWFVVAKSDPTIVFAMTTSEEMSLFEPNTLMIK